jgi:hypothetical protein
MQRLLLTSDQHSGAFDSLGALAQANTTINDKEPHI